MTAFVSSIFGGLIVVAVVLLVARRRPPGQPLTWGEAFFFIPIDKGVAWPEGVTFFGRGRIIISAEQVRDFVAANIYIAMLAVQFVLWAFWQKRGKVAKQRAEREALTTSAYGRPLQKAQA